MITLALLQRMVSDNVADLVIDKNCFWEQAPLQKDGSPASGVWLVTRGGNASRSPKGLNLRSTVDFYVALANKPKTRRYTNKSWSGLYRTHPYAVCPGALVVLLMITQMFG